LNKYLKGWKLLDSLSKVFGTVIFCTCISLSGQDSNETNASQIQSLLLQESSVWIGQGSVFIKENDQSYQRVSQGINQLNNDSYFLSMRERSLAVWHYQGSFIRALGENLFDITPNRISIEKGALLADNRPGNDMLFSGFAVDLEISGKGLFILQATVNGGLKFISLAGRFTLNQPVRGIKKVKLYPGQLGFAHPEKKGFSKILNFNLKTLIASSGLINEFDNEPSFDRELSKAVIEQQGLITEEFRAKVGDAYEASTFDIEKIPEKENR
jgi:hypothetical protein